MASVGPDVEKLEPRVASDHVNGVTSLGNTLAAPQKHEYRDNTCLGLLLLSLQPEYLKVETQPDFSYTCACDTTHCSPQRKAWNYLSIHWCMHGKVGFTMGY